MTQAEGEEDNRLSNPQTTSNTPRTNGTGEDRIGEDPRSKDVVDHEEKFWKAFQDGKDTNVPRRGKNAWEWRESADKSSGQETRVSERERV